MKLEPPAVYQGKFDPRVESADTALRRAVLARLIADPLVSTGHLEVTAIAGRVTLSGYVTSNVQKGAAAAATRRVKGVQEVADDVRVAVPCPHRTELPADALEAPAAPAAAGPFRAFNPMAVNQTDVRHAELRP